MSQSPEEDPLGQALPLQPDSSPARRNITIILTRKDIFLIGSSSSAFMKKKGVPPCPTTHHPPLAAGEKLPQPPTLPQQTLIQNTHPTQVFSYNLIKADHLFVSLE